MGLTQEEMDFVQRLSFKFFGSLKLPSGVTQQDLYSWGLEGCLKAKKKFVPNKKTKFMTFAFLRIRGEILIIPLNFEPFALPI